MAHFHLNIHKCAYLLHIVNISHATLYECHQTTAKYSSSIQVLALMFFPFISWRNLNWRYIPYIHTLHRRKPDSRYNQWHIATEWFSFHSSVRTLMLRNWCHESRTSNTIFAAVSRCIIYFLLRRWFLWPPLFSSSKLRMWKGFMKCMRMQWKLR